jgi:hypothetical protein
MGRSTFVGYGSGRLAFDACGCSGRYVQGFEELGDDVEGVNGFASNVGVFTAYFAAFGGAEVAFVGVFGTILCKFWEANHRDAVGRVVASGDSEAEVRLWFVTRFGWEPWYLCRSPGELDGVHVGRAFRICGAGGSAGEPVEA